MGGGPCLHETLVKCLRWSLGWGGDVGKEDWRVMETVGPAQLCILALPTQNHSSWG